jgi:hypothetical protein
VKKDKLVEIFETHLKKRSNPRQTQAQLIFDVVADYIYHLMQIGNVPHTALDEIEADLKEEVLEIYRKKTYGYKDLDQYRKSQRRSRNKKTGLA